MKKIRIKHLALQGDIAIKKVIGIGYDLLTNHGTGRQDPIDSYLVYCDNNEVNFHWDEDEKDHFLNECGGKFIIEEPEIMAEVAYYNENEATLINDKLLYRRKKFNLL